MENMINRFKDTFVTSLLIILMFVGLAVLWVGKGTYSVSDPTTYDNVLIHCPEGAISSSNITCNVTANFSTVTGLSVNANYSLPEGVSFVSFEVSPGCTENCFEEYANTENGFAIANIDGVVGNHLIGKAVFKLSEDLVANSVYEIGLTNVEISDSEYNLISLDDVSSSVRILSDIATLSSLKINDGAVVIEPSFDSKTFEYSAKVDKDTDKINVSVILTDKYPDTLDPRGEVTGDIGELSLHYGTNEFEIIVTAEDGITMNTYKLSIYREYEYEMNGTVYKYSKDDNYIYTKNDLDKDTIITNLGELSDGLTYQISDDNSKLIIKYIDEVLEEINIVNFDMSKEIIDGQIYVRDLTVEELIDTIKMNKVNVKLVDGSGNEVTSGTIIDDYKFNVYYEDTLLDSYSFVLEYLEISDMVIVDNENMVLSRLLLGTTYGELKESIKTNGEITIISHDDNELTDNIVIRSGDKIRIKFKNDEVVYTLSVLGDLNGDGTVTVGDVSLLYRHVKGRNMLDTIFANSADIINDGNISVGDVSRLYRYLKGRVSTLEVIE